MANNDDDRGFWWTIIKYGAIMTALDHIFPTSNRQYSDYEKNSIERSQRIADLRRVITKYNEEIENLKLKLGEIIYNIKLSSENQYLNVLEKDLNELTKNLQKKEKDLKNVKIFSF